MFKYKLNSRTSVLITILLITVAIRLYLAFTTPNFTYDSYHHLRQVEHITQTGLPLFDDPLSYSGRVLVFLPLFYYFAAIFNLILPIELIGKILPNLLFPALAGVIYLIAKRISSKDNSPIFAALIATLLPISFQTNSFNPLSFSLLFLFLSIYFFLNCTKQNLKKRDVYFFIISLTILCLTTSLAIIFVISLLIYIIFSKLEDQSLARGELELSLFSLFFFLWIQFIFFKDIFLNEGLSFIWQNIPSEILHIYFPKVSITTALFLIGFIPLLAGIYFIYNSLFQKKSKILFLLISIAITSIILTWLRLIEFETSITFLGLILAVLFASFYDQLTLYYKKLKLSRLGKNLNKMNLVTVSVILIIMIPSMLIPAVIYSKTQVTPTNDEVELFIWLEENSAIKDGVLADLSEGNLVTYYSNRKNLMDSQFNLIEDVEERFNAFKTLYSTNFQTEAIKLLEKYQIRYIVLTKSLKEKLEIEGLNYVNNDCFELVYENKDNQIYYLKCALTVS